MHRRRHTYCVFSSRAIGLTLRLLMYWTCEQKETFLHGLVQPSVLTARKTFFFVSGMLPAKLAGFPIPLQKFPVISWLSGIDYLTAATHISCALLSTLAAQTSVRLLFRRFLQYLQTVAVTFLNIDYDNFMSQSQSSSTALVSFDAVQYIIISYGVVG